MGFHNFPKVKSRYTDDEQAWMLNQIKRRAMGQLSDEEWGKVLKLINSSQDRRDIACERCEDNGFYFGIEDGYEVIRKCLCEAGRRDPRQWDPRKPEAKTKPT